MKTIKELEEEFNNLHLKCIEETKKLGRTSYITHGKRCEALAKLEQTNEIIKMILELKEKEQKCLDNDDYEIQELEHINQIEMAEKILNKLRGKGE